MKIFILSKQIKLLLLLIFLFGLIPLEIMANSPSFSEKELERPMAEVLDEMGEKYQVFFNYESELVKGLKVDFELKKGENLQSAVDRLLQQTKLKYEIASSKFIIIFRNDKSGKKNVKKIKRKIRQIDKLQKKRSFSIQRNNSDPSLQALNILQTLAIQIPEKTITGTVKGVDGNPLIGATVQAKGSVSGTVTDIDGFFSLSVADDATTLVISYVGYATQEFEIAGRSSIDIIMTESASILDMVVVTGYGTAKQREITSAITSVSEEDFNTGNVFSTDQLLQGRVAGLAITKAGSDPNQPYFVGLRGVSTLGANSSPLVVIDGVIGGSIENVDPNDVASIDVLKDASAAAIYGTRGSAGVIIITTKTGGTSGKGLVDYNGYVSFDQALNDARIRPANAQEFISFGGVDYGGDTNFEDEVLQTGISHIHNLTFSNNTGSTNYRASINYRDVEGTLLKSGFEQFNGRINVSQKLLDDKLKLSSIVSFTRREINFSNGSALRHASTFAPTAPVYINNDPSQGFFENFVEQNYNPVAMIELNPHLGTRKNLLGNFRADYELLEGLTLGASYAIETTNELQGVYSFSNSRAGAVATNGRADRIASDNINQLFEATATYTRSSGDLTYTVLGGYSYQRLDFERFSVTNTDFITDDLTFNNLGIGNGFNDPNGVRATSSNKEEALLASFFGRINLAYADTYYLSASYRREGSSRFGVNNRWGDFWAVSGGVDITSLTEISFLDNLKLRAGYGVTGNLPIQNYAYLTTLGAVGSGFIDGAFVPAIQPTSNPNPDLKWEEKGEFNIGLDFALLDFKLSGSIDYFKRNTKDLLNTISVSSPPNLFSSSLVNLGELETDGFELQLNYQVFDNSDFQWNITANIAANETILVKFNNDDQVALLRGEGVAQNGSFAALIEEGKPLGQIISPTFGGYNDIGSPLYLDPDGNPTPDNQLAELRTIQGNGLPDFTLGFANSFSYKGLDLNFFFRGAFGHQIANGRRARYEHPSYVGIQNAVITEETTTEDTGLLSWHSKFVDDASFFLLDNATLGYTIPFPDGSTFRKLRFYVSGQKLFTITNYLGSDPEVRYLDRGRSISRTPGFAGNPQYGGDILVPGMDRWELGQYPTRTVSLGVNLGF